MAIHKAGCHCGVVQFEFEAPSQMSVTHCNCSMCNMTGYQHVFVPQDALTFVSGRERLTTYTFNTHAAQHYFCEVCGVKPLYVPRSHPESYSVNLRCISPGTLKVSGVIDFDGQNWEANIEDLQTQTGSRR